MNKEIITRLATTTNFFDIIDLSIKFPKNIDLNDYLHLCPDINITNYDLDTTEESLSASGFTNLSINNLRTFKLKYSDITFTDKVLFLQKIEEVSEFSVAYSNFVTFKVINGEYYKGDSNFRSIEFDLHSTTGPARKEHNVEYYALYCRKMSKEKHKQLIRKVKINKALDKQLLLKDVVRDEELKLREIYLNKKEKKEIKPNITIKFVDYDKI